MNNSSFAPNVNKMNSNFTPAVNGKDYFGQITPQYINQNNSNNQSNTEFAKQLHTMSDTIIKSAIVHDESYKDESDPTDKNLNGKQIKKDLSKNISEKVIRSADVSDDIQIDKEVSKKLNSMNQNLLVTDESDKNNKIAVKKDQKNDESLKINRAKLNQNSTESKSKLNYLSNDTTNSLKNSPVMKILNSKDNLRTNDDDELKIILDLIKNANKNVSKPNTNYQTKLKSNSKDNINININEEKSLVSEINPKTQLIPNLVSKKSIASDILTKEDLKKFKDNEIKEIMKQMNEIKLKLSSVIHQSKEKKTNRGGVLLNKSGSKRKHRKKKSQTKEATSANSLKKETSRQENNSAKRDPITDVFKLQNQNADLKFQNEVLKYQLANINKDDIEKSPSNSQYEKNQKSNHHSKKLNSKLKSDHTTRVEEKDILNSITNSNNKSEQKTEKQLSKKQEKTIGDVLSDQQHSVQHFLFDENRFKSTTFKNKFNSLSSKNKLKMLKILLSKLKGKNKLKLKLNSKVLTQQFYKNHPTFAGDQDEISTLINFNDDELKSLNASDNINQVSYNNNESQNDNTNAVSAQNVETNQKNSDKSRQLQVNGKQNNNNNLQNVNLKDDKFKSDYYSVWSDPSHADNLLPEDNTNLHDFKDSIDINRFRFENRNRNYVRNQQ